MPLDNRGPDKCWAATCDCNSQRTLYCEAWLNWPIRVGRTAKSTRADQRKHREAPSRRLTTVFYDVPSASYTEDCLDDVEDRFVLLGAELGR